MLIIAATREAATTEKGLPITRAVINKLKDQKLLAPAPAQLIRLAMAGRAAARRLSYRELIRDLKPSSILTSKGYSRRHKAGVPFGG